MNTICEKGKLKSWGIIVLITAGFAVVAHGLIFFNLNFRHDSSFIAQMYYGEGTWQISLGRFVQPLYCALRGQIFAPALVGALEVLFFSTAVYLICDVLSIKSAVGKIMCSGVIVTASFISFGNATYIYLGDIFALAMLLAVLAVFVSNRTDYWWLIAPVFVALSLGIYQAYIQVTAMLCMCYVILLLLQQNVQVKAIFKLVLKYIYMLLVGGIIYYFLYHFICKINGIVLSDSYNGLASLGNKRGLTESVELLKGVYRDFWEWFAASNTYNSTLIHAVNVVILICGVCSLVYLLRKRGIASYLSIPVLLLLPLGCNGVYFLAGYSSGLTQCAFPLIYILIMEIIGTAFREAKIEKALILAIPKVLLVIVIFSQMVFANQVYEKVLLEYQNTLLTLNRIISASEQVEGYVIKETPVAFVGRLDQSAVSNMLGGLNYTGDGLDDTFSVTYYSTYRSFINEVMNYPMTIADETTANELRENAEVKDMPSYPQTGYCKLIDGNLVIKLSE